MRGYTAELSGQWRVILGGFLGMSAGLSTTAFVTAIMGTYLVQGLGWTNAQFALTSVVAVSSTFAFPFAGRLADIIGARRTAMIGAVAMPLIFLAFSQMTGFREYIGIYIVQCLLTVTTTAVVYCRIVVQHVQRARGLALAIAASGPGILGIVATPLIGGFVQAYGWRAGYIAMSVAFAVAGGIAIALLPPDRQAIRARSGSTAVAARRDVMRDYRILCRMPAFWIILAGIFLISIPYVVLPQMSLILRENGITGYTASLMVSTYAIGMLIGRIVSGVALDRFSPPVVTFLGLALSAVGIFLIAAHVAGEPILFVAMLLIGFSYGSESDVMAFLVGRYFGVSVYSSVYGILSSVMTAGVAAGATLLSVMLKHGGSYATFLLGGGCSVLVGSLLFLLLPRRAVIPDFDAR